MVQSRQLGGAGILYVLAKFFNVGAFRLARISSFLDPWADPTGDRISSYSRTICNRVSDGLFGVGLGNSTQKYLYIPEPQNDFIFSIIAEELGFVGCTFVIILFAIFVWRGIVIAMRAPDMFGSLVAVRNNCNSRTSSNDKYRSCNIFYTKYRNAASIF